MFLEYLSFSHYFSQEAVNGWVRTLLQFESCRRIFPKLHVSTSTQYHGHVSTFATPKAHVSVSTPFHTHLSSSTHVPLTRVPECSMTWYSIWLRGVQLMACTIVLDYVTVQLWKLAHSTVPPVQILVTGYHLERATPCLSQ